VQRELKSYDEEEQNVYFVVNQLLIRARGEEAEKKKILKN
jgi:hypothetical protein